MRGRTSVLLALVLLLSCIWIAPVQAETVLKDGIEVTLSTDRENYDTFDDVDAKLTVKNTNSFDVENVAMEIKAPQGYLLTSDAQTKVGELSAGEVQQQQASMRDAQAPVPVLPKTGDDSHGMLWGVLFVLSAAGVCAMVIRNPQAKRLVSLLLCVALVAPYALEAAPAFAQEEQATAMIMVSKEVLVNGETVVLTGMVTYQAAEQKAEEYTSVFGLKINETADSVKVREGDTLSFAGKISAEEGATISAVQVFVYDATTEEPYTIGEKYYEADGLNAAQFDLDCVPEMTVGETFGEANYALTEGGRYAVMFYATDSKGNHFADMDPKASGNQGPVINVRVLAAPENCNHSAKEYTYERDTAVASRVTVQDELTHLIEDSYKRYCADCGKYLMHIWGSGSAQEHMMSDGSCSACGYAPVMLLLSNCAHTNTRNEVRETEYEYFDEEWHHVIVYEDVICMDCSTVIGEDMRQYGREHELDANGICRLCKNTGTEVQMLTLSIGKAIEGKNLNVSWNEVPGADYYQYNVRIMDIDQPIWGETGRETSDCALTVDAFFMNAYYEYKIWVGAYADDGHQICQVVEYVVAEEATSNSLNLWVDTAYAGVDLDATWKDLSEADHYEYSLRDMTDDTLHYNRKETTKADLTIPGYMLEDGHQYKLWVGAIVEDGVEPTAEYQATVEFEVTECLHGSPARVNEKYNRVSISDTHHHVKATYDLECIYCEETVETGVKEEYDETHQFDSNGDCKVCDYRASCPHAETKDVETASNYLTYSETQHKYVVNYKVVCANAACGKVIEELKGVTTYQDHTFDGDKCTLCGYTKSAALSVTVTREAASAVQGTQIAATATASGGSGSYKYTWKVLCDGEVIHEEAYDHRASYTPTKAGNWVFTVTVEDANTGETATASSAAIIVTATECTHANKTETLIDTKYIKSSDTQHEIQKIYEVSCADCGTVTNSGYIQSSYEKHAYTDGKCVCGISEPGECKHEGTVVEETVSQTIKQHNADKHKVVTIYRDVCSSCSAVLNAAREHSELVNHAYANGVCACGKLEPSNGCDHAVSEIRGTTTIERNYPDDNKTHYLVTPITVKCDCGLVNTQTIEKKAVAHVYSYVGVESAHPHKEFGRCVCKVTIDLKPTTYDSSCWICNPPTNNNNNGGNNGGNNGSNNQQYPGNNTQVPGTTPQKNYEDVNDLIDDMIAYTDYSYVLNTVEKATTGYKNSTQAQIGATLVTNSMTMLGTTINKVVRNEKQDILQGAIIEMLYGNNGLSSEQKKSIAFGNVTDSIDNTGDAKDNYEDLSEITKDTLRTIELTKNMSSRVRTVNEMRYTILFNKGLITTTGEPFGDAVNSAEYKFYTRQMSDWTLDDFAKMRNDYANVISNQGPKIDYSYKANGEYVSNYVFEKVANKKLESFDEYVEAKKEIEAPQNNKVSNSELAGDIASECVGYVFDLYQNALEAGEELEKYDAIVENELDNIAILTVMYESTTGEVKEACGQILNDAKKNFKGWTNNPAQREMLREDGMATASFACGVTASIVKAKGGATVARVTTSIGTAANWFAVGTILADLLHNGEATKIVGEVEYYDLIENYMIIEQDLRKQLKNAEAGSAEQYYLSELYNTVSKQEAATAVGYITYEDEPNPTIGDKVDSLTDMVEILLTGEANEKWDPEYSEYVTNVKLSNAIYDLQESQNRIREQFIVYNEVEDVFQPENPYSTYQNVDAKIEEIKKAYSEYQGYLHLLEKNHDEWMKNRKIISQNDHIPSAVDGIRPPQSEEVLKRVGARQAELEKSSAEIIDAINKLKDEYNGFRVVQH